MATLTAAQLADLRADLGDQGSPPAFQDGELQRLYDRAGSDYDGAVRLGWRQLWASAAKLADYTAGLSGEKREQVYQHIKEIVAATGGTAPTLGVATLARAGTTPAEWGA